MIIEKKDSDREEGFSLFLVSNFVGLDLFIKKNNKSNFQNIVNFYKRVSRVSIKVNYSTPENTTLFFEHKETDGFYFLLEKITLKKFLKRGNHLMLNPLPIELKDLNKEKKQEIIEKILMLNENDYKEEIDYKGILNAFLKENLRIKNNDIVRFDTAENF